MCSVVSSKGIIALNITLLEIAKFELCFDTLVMLIVVTIAVKIVSKIILFGVQQNVRAE